MLITEREGQPSLAKGQRERAKVKALLYMPVLPLIATALSAHAMSSGLSRAMTDGCLD